MAKEKNKNNMKVKKFLILITIFSTLFTACEEPIENNASITIKKDKLTGTSWKGGVGVYNEIVYLDFYENNKVSITISEYNTTTATDYGTYKVSGNYVSFSGLSVNTRVCNLSLNSGDFTNSIMTINGKYCSNNNSWTYKKIN